MKAVKARVRDITIDGMRTIGIILVVLGHSGCFLTPYIYMFHMALFFMLSGYCYKNINSGFLQFVSRKLKSLYLPYIVYGLIFVLLHNVFVSWDIYTTDEAFLELSSGNSYGLSVVYSAKDIIVQCVRTLLFGNNEQLLGASWFVRVLFCVNILHWFVCCFFKKTIWKYVVGLVSLVVGFICEKAGIHLPMELQSVFPAYTVFVLGDLIRNCNGHAFLRIKLSRNIPVVACATVAIGILFLLQKAGNISLGLNQTVNPLVFILSSLCGYVLVFLFAERTQKYFGNRYFQFFGKHSMCIMLLHFLAFKPVTLAYLLLKRLPVSGLAAFPVLVPNSWIWVPYTIAGVLFPTLFGMVLQGVKNMFGRK